MLNTEYAVALLLLVLVLETLSPRLMLLMLLILLLLLLPLSLMLPKLLPTSPFPLPLPMPTLSGTKLVRAVPSFLLLFFLPGMSVRFLRGLQRSLDAGNTHGIPLAMHFPQPDLSPVHFTCRAVMKIENPKKKKTTRLQTFFMRHSIQARRAGRRPPKFSTLAGNNLITAACLPLQESVANMSVVTRGTHESHGPRSGGYVCCSVAACYFL